MYTGTCARGVHVGGAAPVPRGAGDGLSGAASAGRARAHQGAARHQECLYLGCTQRRLCLVKQY